MAKRILFITGTRIGDAVLSTGLLAHLVATEPEARFTIACGAPAAPLFAAVPRLDRVVVIEKKPLKAHWLSLWLACAGLRWDLVVDLRRSGFAWLLWAARRRVKRAGFPELHRVEEDARVLGLDPPSAPRVWVDHEAAAAAARLLPGDGPVLAIGPTANWGAKEWRIGNFTDLVRRLTASDGILPGATIAVLGAPDERDRAQSLIESVPGGRIVDLFGQSLPVAYACLARSAMFIGNDSGLMHLAAASGTPTLGLFGPSPEWHYGPWGAHTAVARTRESYRELVEAPDFDHRNTATLMDGLTVDMALEAAEALWRKTAG